MSSEKKRASSGARIAQDLNDPEKIMSAIQSKKKQRPILETAFLAPETPLESTIAKMCEEILLIDQIGVNDSLIDLGIDSLGFAQLSAKISIQLQTEISFEAIFNNPSVRGIAEVTSKVKK